jgi:hypothetical protein
MVAPAGRLAALRKRTFLLLEVGVSGAIVREKHIEGAHVAVAEHVHELEPQPLRRPRRRKQVLDGGCVGRRHDLRSRRFASRIRQIAEVQA